MGYIKTLPLPPPRCRSVPHQLPPASAVCIVGIFPSADAYTRLVTTYLMEYAEDWSASRAYLSEQSVQAMLRPAA